jgi:N-acetylmuramic acid 6-phosphate etherase
VPAPELFDQIQRLATEQRNPRSMALGTAGVREILEIINTEDHLVPIAVRGEIPWIEQTVEAVVRAFQSGGRLIYCGAGTSGRLGIVDASECPPTFGSDPDLVQGLIAGGPDAIFKAKEGAEDHESNGADALREIGTDEKDVVVGIAASRRTPYVVGALKHARAVGATSVLLTCNPRSSVDQDVDIAICPVVGPEVVMGSTRMKSGTAQKLVLNMITTAAFVRMGKVYENMMVDLQMTNAKLVERSRRIVMTATGLDYDAASAALDAAEGHVKTALVMVLTGADRDEAARRIEAAGGFVGKAVEAA